MKRIFLISAITSSFLFADFIGAEFELGGYYGDPEGTLSYHGTDIDLKNDLNLNRTGNIIASASFEHPVPIIPNLKVGFKNIYHEGEGRASQDFTFSGFNFTVSDDVETLLEVNMYDATAYYEILDNWLSVDLGVTLRYLDGESFVETSTINKTAKFSLPIPMGYGRVKLDIPTTDISLITSGNFIQYKDNIFYDGELGVRANIFPTFNIEGGYKFTEVQLDYDDFNLNSSFNGVYAKAVLDF